MKAHDLFSEASAQGILKVIQNLSFYQSQVKAQFGLTSLAPKIKKLDYAYVNWNCQTAQDLEILERAVGSRVE